MSDTALLDLRGIAQHVNRVARSVLEEEGEHPAMYFLPAGSDELQGYVFVDTETRPVGEARGLELPRRWRHAAPVSSYA